jgi:hypothetical protein
MTWNCLRAPSILINLRTAQRKMSPVLLVTPDLSVRERTQCLGMPDVAELLIVLSRAVHYRGHPQSDGPLSSSHAWVSCLWNVVGNIRSMFGVIMLLSVTWKNGCVIIRIRYSTTDITTDRTDGVMGETWFVNVIKLSFRRIIIIVSSPHSSSRHHMLYYSRIFTITIALLVWSLCFSASVLNSVRGRRLPLRFSWVLPVCRDVTRRRSVRNISEDGRTQIYTSIWWPTCWLLWWWERRWLW